MKHSGRAASLIFFLSLFSLVLGGCDLLFSNDSSSIGPDESTFSDLDEESELPENSSSWSIDEEPKELTIEFAYGYPETIYVGSTTFLRASFDWNYVLADWESGDESIATVEKGTVFGIEEGTVDIYARYTDVDGQEYVSSIQIEILYKAGPVLDVSFTNDVYEMKVGDSLCLDDIAVVIGDQRAERSYKITNGSGDDQEIPGEPYSFDAETATFVFKKIAIIDVKCVVGDFFDECTIVINGEYSAGFTYEEKEDGSYRIVEFYGIGSKVVVPDEWNGRPVTEVSAFIDEDVEELVFGKNVTVFTGGCPDLQKVNINNLQIIGTNAFQGLMLSTIEFSPNLQYIGRSAFSGSPSLTKVVIPASTREIDENAFFDCRSLRYAYVPSTVEIIGSGAFPYECHILSDAPTRQSGWNQEFCNPRLASFGTEAILEDPSGIRFALVDNSASPYAAVFDYAGPYVDEINVPSEIAFDNGSYPVKAILERAFAGGSASTIRIPATVDTISDEAFSYFDFERLVVEGSLTRFTPYGHDSHLAAGEFVLYTTGEAGGFSAIEHFKEKFTIHDGVEYALVADLSGNQYAVATALRGDDNDFHTVQADVQIDGTSYPVISAHLIDGKAGEITIEEGVEIIESAPDCNFLTIPSTIRQSTLIRSVKALFSPVGPDVLLELGIRPYLEYMPGGPTAYAHSYAGWHGIVDGGLYSLYRASSGVVQAMFVCKPEVDVNADFFEVHSSVEVDGVNYPVTALAYGCEMPWTNIVLPATITHFSSAELGAEDCVFSRGKVQTNDSCTIVQDYAGAVFSADGYRLALCRDEEHGEYLTIYNREEFGGPVVDLPSSFFYEGREYPVGVLTGRWLGAGTDTFFSVPASVFRIDNNNSYHSALLIREGSTIEDSSIEGYSVVLRNYLGRSIVKDDVLYGLFGGEAAERLVLLSLLEDKSSLRVPSETEVDGRVYPITEICKSAFSKVSVTSLYIPGSVENLPSNLMSDHDELVSFAYGEGGISIDKRAFDGCYSLKEVSLPSTLKSIGPYAFYNCNSVEEMDLPDGLETIGSAAFYGCDSLRELYVPDSVETIGMHAFYITNENCHIYLASTGAKDGFEPQWDLTGGAVIVFGVKGENSNE